MKYRIIHRISFGSDTCLYKIQDKTTGELRALRTIKKTNIKSDKEQDFIRELEGFITYSNLHSKGGENHLMKIYEYYVDDVNYLLILEHIQGTDLFSILLQLDSYSHETVHQIIKQLLIAINNLHSNLKHGHYSICPENLTVTLKDETGNPSENLILKLDKISSINYSNNKHLKYTPFYIPPELFVYCTDSSNRQIKLDIKSDLWSVGVLIHTLFYGYPIFLGETGIEILNNISKGELLLINNADYSEVNKVISSFVTNVEKRPNTHDIFSLPWIENREKKFTSSTPNFALYDSLKRYIYQEKMIKSVVDFIDIYNYIQDLAMRLLTMYRISSVNLKSYHDLRYAFEIVFGPTIADFELERIFSCIKKDKDGLVDYVSFLSLFLNKNLEQVTDNLKKYSNLYLNIFDKGVVMGDIYSLLKKSINTNLDKLLNNAELSKNSYFSFDSLLDLLKSIYKIYA